MLKRCQCRLCVMAELVDAKDGPSVLDGVD